MIQAASYVQHNARADARRAIVIMTDDQTQDDEDVQRVDDALGRANAVLSFLQAPYEPPTMMSRRRGPWGGGGGGGGWGGGGIGFPGGGGGGGWPGGGGMGRRGGGGVDPSHSAGTADIARDSGGDTMNVEEASSLEDTLMRLRQRYALYFNYPEGTNASGPENVKVDLSNEAKIRFADAEIHYRHVYMASNASRDSGTTSVTRTHVPAQTDSSSSTDTDTGSSTPTPRRRTAVSDDSGSSVNTVNPDADSPSPSNRSPSSASPSPAPSKPATSPGGWPSAAPDNNSQH